MAAYARFDGFPGDTIRNGRLWITLDSWLVGPTHVSASGRQPTTTDLVLTLRNVSLGPAFAGAMANGKTIPTGELAVTEIWANREVQILSVKLGDIRVVSLLRAPAITVTINVVKITMVYVPMPSSVSTFTTFQQVSQIRHIP